RRPTTSPLARGTSCASTRSSAAASPRPRKPRPWRSRLACGARATASATRSTRRQACRASAQSRTRGTSHAQCRLARTVAAWASPTAPAELLRSLTVEDTAVRINPLKAPGMALWGLKFLRECNAKRSSKNTLVKLRLAQYSQRMLDQITADEHIDYDDIHEGL